MKYENTNKYQRKLYEDYVFIKMCIRSLEYRVDLNIDEITKLNSMVEYYRDIYYDDDLRRMFFYGPWKLYDVCKLPDVIEIKKYLKKYLKNHLERNLRLDKLKTKKECPFVKYDNLIECSCGSAIKMWNFEEHSQAKKHTQYCVENNFITYFEKQDLEKASRQNQNNNTYLMLKKKSFFK